MKKYAYTTLITTDVFVPCVIRQAQRMKYLKFKYPYIPVVTNTVSKESLQILEKNNIRYKLIPYQNYKNIDYFEEDLIQTKNYEDFYFQDHIVKFEILRLTEFEKVLFVDADAIFLKNIDYVFDLYNFKKDKNFIFYAIKETEKPLKPFGMHFFCKPDLNLLKKMKDNFFKNYQNYNDDENLVNKYFYDQIQIMPELNNATLHFTGSPKFWTLNQQAIKYIFFEASSKEFNEIIDNYAEEIDFLNSLFLETTKQLSNFAYEKLNLYPIQKRII